MYKSILLSSLLALVSLGAFGRQTNIDTLLSQVPRYISYTPQETLYIEADKNIALEGESVSIEVWLYDTFLEKISSLSQIAYLDIISNNDGAVIETLTLSLTNGYTAIRWNVPSLASGEYFIKGYTATNQHEPHLHFYYPIIFLNETFIDSNNQLGLGSRNNPIIVSPEGGNLVKGLGSKVYFYYSESKNGDLWTVKDSNNEQVLTFETDSLGLGIFYLNASDNTYTITNDKGLSQKLTTSQTLSLSTQFINNKLRVLIQTHQQEEQDIHIVISNNFQILQTIKEKVSKESPIIQLIATNNWNPGIYSIDVFNNKGQKLATKDFLQIANNLVYHQESQQISNRAPIDFTEDKKSIPSPSNYSVWFRKKNVIGNYQVSLPSFCQFPRIYQSGLFNHFNIYNLTERQAEIIAGINCSLLPNKWEIILNKDGQFTYQKPETHLSLQGSVFWNGEESQPDSLLISLYMVGQNMGYQKLIKKEDSNFQIPLFSFEGIDQTIVLIRNTDYSINPNAYALFSSRKSKSILPKFSLQYDNKDLEHYYRQTNIEKEISSVYALIENEEVTTDERNTDIKSGVFDFPYEADLEIILSEYTTMPTMEEVFRELLMGATYRLRKGEHIIRVFSEDRNQSFTYSPLLVVDGNPGFTAEEIIAINPAEVYKIRVIKSDKKLSNYGNIALNGIILIDTFKKQIKPNNEANISHQVSGFSPAIAPVQFQLPSINAPQIHHPQLNSTLLYIPPRGSASWKCYTSDQEGTFLFKVQGFTTNNIPFIFTRPYFINKKGL